MPVRKKEEGEKLQGILRWRWDNFVHIINLKFYLVINYIAFLSTTWATDWNRTELGVDILQLCICCFDILCKVSKHVSHTKFLHLTRKPKMVDMHFIFQLFLRLSLHFELENFSILLLESHKVQRLAFCQLYWTILGNCGNIIFAPKNCNSLSALFSTQPKPVVLILTSYVMLIKPNSRH